MVITASDEVKACSAACPHALNGGMFDIVLSVMVLSAAALLAGAFYLWRKKNNTKQASLMAILALIFLMNVAIWAIPVEEEGAALHESSAQD